ncbi:hypothetical protein MNBD_GAMMA12-3423 [hydrothermal vent metagenome]|uniref:HDOD domain-containing protein n=1 Tax=hydrothermal vent metagenome TaxID=652676 RepID=A0A3B0YJI0_9ZZZZ
MTEPQNSSGNSSSSDYHDLVNEVDHLVSLPTVCVKIMTLLNDPHSTAKDIERVLIQDPPLTAQLLRMANSPFYGLRSQIDTLSRAVSVIGTKRIHNLVLAVSAIKSFDKLTNGIISIENFWSHSIYTGLIANILAKHSSVRQNDAIFIAGLLHDIGQLVIFNKRPDDVRVALTLMQDSSNDSDLYLYEREVMGFDHMQVGSELARRWLLPENLIACIEYHHLPSLAPSHNLELALVYLGNRLASLAELNSLNMDDIPPISKQMWEITGLTPEIIEQVLDEAQEQFESSQAILLN